MNTTKTLLLVCMFAAWVTVPAMSQSETKQKSVNISVTNRLYKGNSFFKADTKRTSICTTVLGSQLAGERQKLQCSQTANRTDKGIF